MLFCGSIARNPAGSAVLRNLGGYVRRIPLPGGLQQRIGRSRPEGFAPRRCCRIMADSLAGMGRDSARASTLARDPPIHQVGLLGDGAATWSRPVGGGCPFWGTVRGNAWNTRSAPPHDGASVRVVENG